jgi:hypothetical protein
LTVTVFQPDACPLVGEIEVMVGAETVDVKFTA